MRTREQHERDIREIVERFRNEGYFRPGETVEVVDPVLAQKWIACVDTTALTNPPAELARAAAAKDPLEAAFEAAGYRVSVTPDFEKSTDEVDGCSYFLYEQDPK